MKWLHLSDIHYTFRGYDTLELKNKLINKLSKLDLNLDFILITGDCFYRYNASNVQQKELSKFIRSIARKCNCPYNHIYLCPGNHDVNRNDSKRNSTIEEIRKGTADFDERFNDLTEAGNEKYQNLYKSITGYDYTCYKIFSPKEKLYRIVSLNTSILSKDNDDEGKLRICNEYLSSIESQIKDDNRVNILIMHHDIDFLAKDDAKKFQHWADDNNIDMVFSGHTHKAAIESFNDTFRDIKQITSGAIVVDEYAIPSFYICEYDDISDVSINLFTYSKNKEEWVEDNFSLRTFKNGVFSYTLPRKEYNKRINEYPKDITLIDSFNKKYRERYQTDKIFSNKYSGKEEFNAWKIVNSLVNVGMSYNQALLLTDSIIKTITKNDFYTSLDFLSCYELRTVVYDTIVNYRDVNNETKFDTSCWASRYARKYNQNQELITIGENRSEKINYSYVKNVLIKNIIDTITNNECYYLKISGKELCLMAESILGFLKNIAIFEIQEKVLFDLIKEYITQKPHPWIENGNHNELISYHKTHAKKHIEELKGQPLISSQIEAAYHICSLFILRYDKFIGCNETSPIISLTNSVNWFHLQRKLNQNKLPMFKHEIIQLKKELESQSISFFEFVELMNTIYNSIIEKRDISNQKTKNSILKMWDIFKKLEQIESFDYEKSTILSTEDNSIRIVKAIFESATGFIVKKSIQDLSNCFWIEPNWEKYEYNMMDLDKQILICVINNSFEIEKALHYFSPNKKNKKGNDIAFIMNDFSEISNKNKICDYFKNCYVRCIFIQKSDFSKITKKNNWRNIFLQKIKESKLY